MPTSAAGPMRCARCEAPLTTVAELAFCAACAWQQLEPEEDSAERAPQVLFVVPGHEVLQEVARGGSGVVYRARQLEPLREVALKMLLPQQLATAERVTRFRLEIATVAALDHPSILPVYLSDDYRGLPFFTMKFAAGGSLAARIPAYQGRWNGIAELVARLAEAVQYAHTHGVIHRDLKPGNVLFDAAGHEYVSDFGIAKVLEGQLAVTQTLSAFGTPAYLAPEVVQHGAACATTATDVYGLGTLLYELLTQRPPFAHTTVPRLLRAVVDEDPLNPRRCNPGVPRDLEVLALRCLAKEPHRRIASAQDLAADLRNWLHRRPITARHVGQAERLWKWARRNPAMAVVGGALIGSLLSGGLLLVGAARDLKETSLRALDAERVARERLHASLVDQARVLRGSTQVGQRAAALELLSQVAAGTSDVAALRSEYIAALVRPDLEIVQRQAVVLHRSDYTVDLSPDLQRMLVALPGEGFAEIEVATGQVLRRCASGGREAWYLGYGPQGGVLVSYRDHSTEWWLPSGQEPVWRGEGVYGRDQQPRPVAVHPAGEVLAHVAADDRIEQVDLATGEERSWLPAAGEVRLISFDPAGRRLLVVYRDRASAWSWPEGTLEWTLPGPMSPARPAWSSDGGEVAMGWVGDDDIVIVHAQSGRPRRTLAAHGADVRLLAFRPGGRWIASVAWDGRLMIHDHLTGELVLRREAWVRVLRFSADGAALGFSDNHVAVSVGRFARTDLLEEFGHEPLGEKMGSRVAASPDGRWLVSADFDETRIWDARTRALVRRWRPPASVIPTSELNWGTVLFHPSGDELWESRRYTGLIRRRLQDLESQAGAGVEGEAVEFWSAPVGDLMAEQPSGDVWLQRLDTREVVVWPAGVADQERRLGPFPSVDGAQVSTNGQWLARPNYPSPGVQILDARTGRSEVELGSAPVLSLSFSHDSQRLLVCTGSQYQLWATAGWSLLATWPARIDGGGYGGGFESPQGDIIAVLQAQGGIEIRTTDQGRLLARLEFPYDLWIAHAAWSPRGDRLYTLSLGHRVHAWDLGALRRELEIRGLNW